MWSGRRLTARGSTRFGRLPTRWEWPLRIRSASGVPVRQLTEFHRGRGPEKLTEAEVRDYLVWLRGEKRAAPGTLKIAINGIRSTRFDPFPAA